VLLRRPRVELETGKLIVGDLTLNRETYSASRASKPIALTPKEFTILEYLMRHQGKVVSRSMILEHAWDDRGDLLSNSIETHIANLRRKIDRGRKLRLIETISGQGYRICGES
jgi:DNA-binding response OmpR family regulator